MKIEVFAVLKDFYDKHFIVEEVLQDIEELKSHLMVKNPEAKKILNSCRFAVNDELVNIYYKLKADDLISIIPPSSGG